MTKFVLCARDALAPNGVVRVDLPNGMAIAVYNVDGDFYATDNACTHGEASLAEGEVVDGQIVCPFHGGTFDIKSGAPSGAPCIVPLKTYRVDNDGDHLYVDL